MRHLVFVLTFAFAAVAAPEPVAELRNPSFEETAENGLPDGWKVYMKVDDNRHLGVSDVAHEGQRSISLIDHDPNEEIGVFQDLPCEPGKTYQLELWVRAASPGKGAGAFLQMRFPPSEKWQQRDLVAGDNEWRRNALVATAPADAKTLRIYLYSHRETLPEVLFDDLKLTKVDPEDLSLLKNGSFEEGVADNGVPLGWSVYAGLDAERRISVTAGGADGDHACLLEDHASGAEVGLTQSVAAEGGVGYRCSVQVRPAGHARPVGCYLQMRFLPSNEYLQRPLMTRSGGKWRTITAGRVAPEGTTQIVIYLYSHAGPTPRYYVDDVKLTIGDASEGPGAMTVPAPVPPEIPKLKDLHLQTRLVTAGNPSATIVAPAAQRPEAERLQATVKRLTGVDLPVVTPDDPAAAMPFSGNLILLGNRSTNAALSYLYDRYYTLLDLKYPGPAGHVVRSLHNPFGNGFNAVLVGGSDAAGVSAAAGVLCELLAKSGDQPGELALGWTMELKLSPSYQIPENLQEVQTWEASDGYGSSGYFGWNSISKRMALYYMTGDPQHAREALRLALPDQAAKDELARTDGEMIENKDAPLSGPYHYNAHMMILFWDLIEESPVFTDAERLTVTRAFAQQLLHRKDEGIYPLTEPPQAVGSRHGQWSANSLYCLGRYFEKDYPDPIWAQCVRGAQFHFQALNESPWLAGESDNLFWFSTGIAPVFSYLCLTGDRGPVESGSVGVLLRAQEALLSGRQPDWALRSASLGYLNKAAYITQDGRWLTYRNRTAMDTSIFRLGQSYWPDASIAPAQPRDLVNQWNVYALPEPAWWSRNSGLEFEQSAQWSSYRSSTGSDGDYILLDSFNGASRNPYHTFAILELRLNGNTILRGPGASQGYYNQVLTHADGMVEPAVAMDAALQYHGVVGQYASAIGDVPQAAFCDWRRILAQRVGKYALIVDDLTFRTDSRNMEVETLWQTENGTWDQKRAALVVRPGEGEAPLPDGWVGCRSWDVTCTTEPAGQDYLKRLSGLNITLLRSEAPGTWLDMPFHLDRAVSGDGFVDLVDYVDRCKVKFLIDGQPVGQPYDHWASDVVRSRAELGHLQLAAGEHVLRVEVVERHDGMQKTYVGLGGLLIRPDGVTGSAPSTVEAYELRPCDPLPTRRGGSVTTMTWRGEAKAGGHRRLFTLLAPSGPQVGEPACLRLDDHTAALALPAPAIAAAGGGDWVDGDLAIVSGSRLYGLNVKRVGAGLVTADQPVTIDWDLAAGTAAVEAAGEAVLRLKLAANAEVKLDGQAVTGELKLSAGAHHLTGATPAAGDLEQTIAAQLAEGRKLRAEAGTQSLASAPLEAPELAPSWTANVGGAVVDLALAPELDGGRIYAAEGQAVHALGADGKPGAVMPTDGPLKVIHWWPGDGQNKDLPLLLAGCRNERLFAFGADGKQRWTFTSVMDPAVFRAAKQYWFKTAPGHEGIHGLGSGPFIDGQNQAFVGSACTLEVLNPDGSLAKRMAAFWGPGKLFGQIPRPDGSHDLLIAREPTDGHHLDVVNSKRLDVRRMFAGVPAGHSYVGGWACMSRDHIFHVDLDGDGKQEIVSEINGTWNRLTVWDEDDHALYNAQFGPGISIPHRNVRDVDLTDLDGDGKQEILVGLEAGLVLALDHQCQRVWSTRLPSPPRVLATVGTQVLVGCDDASVVVLDAKGEPIALGKLDSRPTKVVKLEQGDRTLVVIGTDKGGVTGFMLPVGK